jgi:hypothetical protein
MHTPPEWAFHLLVWSLAAIGPEPTTEMAATKISLSMKKSDVTCPDCFAGYRRIELEFRKGLPGSTSAWSVTAFWRSSTVREKSPTA